MSQKFVVWTDASSDVNQERPVTAVGYVIKHGKMPPLIGSEIKKGVYNSTGELMAGTECLSSLKTYCEDLGIKMENRKVIVKTDFHYLKEAVDSNSHLRYVRWRLNGGGDKLNPEERIKFQRKLELLRELESLKSNFKAVACEEIRKGSNIAHNVGLIRMRRYKESRENDGKHYESENAKGLITSFYGLYEHPEECVIKIPSLKAS